MYIIWGEKFFFSVLLPLLRYYSPCCIILKNNTDITFFLIYIVCFTTTCFTLPMFTLESLCIWFWVDQCFFDHMKASFSPSINLSSILLCVVFAKFGFVFYIFINARFMPLHLHVDQFQH